MGPNGQVQVPGNNFPMVRYKVLESFILSIPIQHIYLKRERTHRKILELQDAIFPVSIRTIRTIRTTNTIETIAKIKNG